MKKTIFTGMILCALMTVFSAQARTLRVGYGGPQLANTDYPSLSTAVTAALTGDTIQVYQGLNTNIGSATLTKRLVILGFGYNFSANPGLQVALDATSSFNLTFDPGSDNSVVQGLVLSSTYVGTSNIMLQRCKLSSLFVGFTSTNSQSVNISNLSIIGCIITNLSGNNGTVSNVLFTNNITNNVNMNNVTGLIANNDFLGAVSFGACVIKNNIFGYFSVTGPSAVFQYNLFNSNVTVTGSNNLFSVDMSTVYADWLGYNMSTSSESKLALKAGSPALNFGMNSNNASTDAGVYGGDAAYVYKLSGIPNIPSIYQLSAPSLNATNNPYTITVSVRSNN
jgi:hypothetical protein